MRNGKLRTVGNLHVKLIVVRTFARQSKSALIVLVKTRRATQARTTQIQLGHVAVRRIGAGVHEVGSFLENVDVVNRENGERTRFVVQYVIALCRLTGCTNHVIARIIASLARQGKGKNRSSVERIDFFAFHDAVNSLVVVILPTGDGGR